MRDELITRPEGSESGVPALIKVNKPPKNFRDAMSRGDRQECFGYQGLPQHGTPKLVLPELELGTKVIGTTTRTEYKVVNGSSRSALSGYVSWIINGRMGFSNTWENCTLLS